MQVKFLTAMDTDAGPLPAGTLVAHPDCFLLADTGDAAAVDTEAEESLAKWRKAKAAHTTGPVPGFEFVGRDVPTVFTLPDKTQRVVSLVHGEVVVTAPEQPAAPEPVDA